MGMETFSLTEGRLLNNELYINFDGIRLCPSDLVRKDRDVIHWK